MIKDMKALIAEFQIETHSNSVLDFITWFENRTCLEKSRRFKK